MCSFGDESFVTVGVLCFSHARIAYANLENGNIIDGPALAPSLTVYYKGEGDTSNLGSNKGIYDNKMNAYAELTASIKEISDNVFALANYFDEK